MNKEIYFEKLKHNLQKLSQTEREEALAYYQEYSIDAQLDTYEKVEVKFGAPEELAAKIYAESAVKTMESEKESWLTPFRKGAAAFFVLPMTFPLAISAGAIAFAMIVSVTSIIFAGGSVIVVLAGTAATLFVKSFAFLFALDFIIWAKCFGGALALGAISVLLLGLGYQLIKWIVRTVTKHISKKVSGRSPHE